LKPYRVIITSSGMYLRNKPRQIPAKEFQGAQLLVEMGLSVVATLPLACEAQRQVLEDILERLRVFFKDSEPVKDPTNSHTPPGGSHIKPATPREKGKRKPGGQEGHRGHTHELEPAPDKVVVLPPPEKVAGPDWRREDDVERRQVIDLEIRKTVVEFQAPAWVNVRTGEKVRAAFPEGVEAPVQFGENVKAVSVILRDMLNAPFEKASDFFETFGLSVSPSTIVNMVREAEGSHVLADFERAAKADLPNDPCLNVDETPLKLGLEKVWAHGMVGRAFTLFLVHPKRGLEAIKEIGLLENFTGFLVHDCLASYFALAGCVHCLCGAHILRELQAAVDMGQKWAEDMRELLLDTCEEVCCYGGMLPLHLQAQAVKEYGRITAEALEATGGVVLARPPGQKGKRGRFKRPKYRNLLERLVRHEDAVLRFMTSPLVPFTNNNVERPIRMLKVRIKISGCFRSLDMVEGFCRMRGYILSCQKNGITAHEAIKMAVRGQVPDFFSERLPKNVQQAA
jgi:transposase